MKKSIIAAGAASVALAAMPIVGVMAVDFTDVIKTTIAESCSFTRQATAHGASESWDEGSSVSPATTTDAMHSAASITPTAAEKTIGTSNFNVVCNDHDGYSVTATTPELQLTSGTQNHHWYYDNTAATTASYWKIATTGDNPVLTPDGSGNIIVSTKTSSEDNKNFTITYSAYAIMGQDAGTYSASVDYTFAQL